MDHFIKSVLISLLVALALSNALPFRDEPAMRGLESTPPGLALTFFCVALLLFSRFALLAYTSFSAMADEIGAEVTMDDLWGHLVYGFVTSLLLFASPFAAMVAGGGALLVAALIVGVILMYAYRLGYLPYKVLSEYPLSRRAMPLGSLKSLLAGVIAFVASEVVTMVIDFPLMLYVGWPAPYLYFRSVGYAEINTGSTLLPLSLLWSWGEVAGIVVTAYLLRSLYDVLMG